VPTRHDSCYKCGRPKLPKESGTGFVPHWVKEKKGESHTGFVPHLDKRKEGRKPHWFCPTLGKRKEGRWVGLYK
jgi:hypothetical protein